MDHLTLVEHPASSYAPRTHVNAEGADLTVAFAIDFTTAGEKLTRSLARDRYFAVDITHDRYLVEDQLITVWTAGTMNIAGNGIYTLHARGWDQPRINEYIYRVLLRVHTIKPITRILSGGQTGADVAGAIAGLKLGIDTVVTMPLGFKLRRMDNRDKCYTREQIVARYEHYLSK